LNKFWLAWFGKEYEHDLVEDQMLEGVGPEQVLEWFGSEPQTQGGESVAVEERHAAKVRLFLKGHEIDLGRYDYYVIPDARNT